MSAITNLHEQPGRQTGSVGDRALQGAGTAALLPINQAWQDRKAQWQVPESEHMMMSTQNQALRTALVQQQRKVKATEEEVGKLQEHASKLQVLPDAQAVQLPWQAVKWLVAATCQ